MIKGKIIITIDAEFKNRTREKGMVKHIEKILEVLGRADNEVKFKKIRLVTK